MEEKFKYLLALFLLVTIIEIILIMAGVLAPFTTGSNANTMFSIMKLAIVAYAGWIFAHQGLKAAAIKGSVMIGAGILLLFLSSITAYFGAASSNLNPGTIYYMAAFWGITLLLNMLIGAAMAVASALLSNFVNKKAKEKRKKK